MAERWSKKMSLGGILTVEIREVAEPKPMWPSDPDGPKGVAELVYPNGATYVFSSVEKVRLILGKRGFRPSDLLSLAPGPADDDPPQRAI